MVMFEEILGINGTDVTVYMHGTYNTMDLTLHGFVAYIYM